ncbi:MAG: crossover junction endodeoxyribonuclease RuvC [bacterium]|nr:crossover junction endodeoxyribonuclease RuvC [bacterium]
MKILGIDPGMAIVGYGLIEYKSENNGEISLLASGSIQTDKKLDDSKRLLEIYNDLSEIVNKYSPDCASVENLFFFKNQKTVIPVAEARGVILTVLEKFNIPTYSYTPMEVKQILTGYGRADKKEVEQMVKIALNKNNLPKLDDTVDAIAIAICHTRNIIQ